MGRLNLPSLLLLLSMAVVSSTSRPVDAFEATSGRNETLVREIRARALATGSDSLVIREKGRTIVSEFYGHGDRVRNLQSVTKSFAGLALAMLKERGRLASYDLPMHHWIPSWKSDKEKSRITLRMIMNHTSGLPAMIDGLFEADDVTDLVARAPSVGTPGAQHLYSNAGAMLLSTVIQQSAGQSVEAFLNEFLFSPLGVRDAQWKYDGTKLPLTSGGLSLSTNDLVKVGELLLANGRWKGRQIISLAALRELTSPSQTYFDYGLLFWLNRSQPGFNFDLYSAVGRGGQFLTVFPSKGLIAIRTRDPRTIDEDRLEEQYFRDFRDFVSRWQ